MPKPRTFTPRNIAIVRALLKGQSLKTLGNKHKLSRARILEIWTTISWYILCSTRKEQDTRLTFIRQSPELKNWWSQQISHLEIKA